LGPKESAGKYREEELGTGGGPGLLSPVSVQKPTEWSRHCPPLRLGQGKNIILGGGGAVLIASFGDGEKLNKLTVPYIA